MCVKAKNMEISQKNPDFYPYYMEENPDDGQFVEGTPSGPRLLRITTAPVSLHILLRGQLEFMQRRGFCVLAVSSDGPEVAEVRKAGIDHHCVEMTRAISPVSDLISLWKLMRIVRSFRPDIIHSHTPKAGLLGMMAGWLCGVPIRMHTVAGLPLMESRGFTRWLLIQAERLTYRFATKVLVNSFGLADYINRHISRRIDRSAVLVGGSSNGIDLGYFDPEALRSEGLQLRRKMGCSDNCVVFVFVGRLVRDKGVGELLIAFDRVQSRLTECALVLVGSEEPERDPLLPSEREQITNGKGIYAAGYQQDVRPWIMSADVLVLPSYREGLPNVLLQAGALEKPAIASDINGCNEIIADGFTGVLVKPRDQAGLAEAMYALAIDPTKRAAMAKAARLRIAGRYDQQQIWTALESTYRKLLAGLQSV